MYQPNTVATLLADSLPDERWRSDVESMMRLTLLDQVRLEEHDVRATPIGPMVFAAEMGQSRRSGAPNGSRLVGGWCWSGRGPQVRERRHDH